MGKDVSFTVLKGNKEYRIASRYQKDVNIKKEEGAFN